MQTNTKAAPPKNVNDYMGALLPKQRKTLSKLRKIILAELPGAEELISYQIPTAKYNGKRVVAYAAFSNHYSLFPMSGSVISTLEKDLAEYEISKGTIRLDYNKPIPIELIKKIVAEKLKQSEKKQPSKKTEAPSTPSRAKTPKLTDEEKVALHMKKLKHPLKAEMEAVREIIKNANSKISERIKWNAPSYYYKEDLVTFNGWARNEVHLVFHHPSVVKIKSPLLEGDYPTRRMAYFREMKDVKSNKKELERIINILVKNIDTK
jgi:uncharacterized protein YdhG (YjbR/CyaY superfamily)